MIIHTNNWHGVGAIQVQTELYIDQNQHQLKRHDDLLERSDGLQQTINSIKDKIESEESLRVTDYNNRTKLVCCARVIRMN